MTSRQTPVRLISQRVKGDDLSNVNGMVAAGHAVYLSWTDAEDKRTALLISEVLPREFGDEPTDRHVKFVEDVPGVPVKADDYVWIHIIERK
ncbi:hypothetical protein HMPREF0591_5944 [Mycobacterium parascrofulaceum ATCC BAA-614]|uniref:Uncharacterized protein n=2 Tax=Mycobacterium parascrofulaceum TaxID=240125 RepID=D5PIF0_9MYCO|nr:hypothetical protein [Mycobacterium malmoense]EFG74163.1 hypothetical protein HMPREF0591_5944 [Mycobacterium parascrofulaceum ATCC BAA-614]